MGVGVCVCVWGGGCKWQTIALTVIEQKSALPVGSCQLGPMGKWAGLRRALVTSPGGLGTYL